MKLQRVVTNWHKHRKAIALLAGVTVVGASIANAQKISSFVRWVRAGTAFNAGVAADMNGSDEWAIASFTKALVIEPSFISAYEHRGTAHLAIEDYESAIADLLKTAPTSKEKDQVALSLGNAYFALGDATNALTYYSAALNASPDLAEAHVGEGNVYYQQQDYWKALEKFENALAIDEELLNARWGKAVVQAQLMGGLGEPKEDLSFVLSILNDPLTRSLQPDSDTVYLLMGEINYDKGNYQKSYELIDKAIELNDENPLAYLLRGNVHRRNAEYRAALEAYMKASDLLTVEQFGVGISIARDKETKAIEIKNIFEDIERSLKNLAQSPKKGDLILAIDGLPVTDISLSKIQDQLKGEKNSTVRLELYREDEGELSVEVPRQYNLTQLLVARVAAGRAYTYRDLGDGENAIASCQQFNKTKVENAYVYSVCGQVHQLFGEQETAIQYFQNSLALHTKQENEDAIKEVEKMLVEVELD